MAKHNGQAAATRAGARRVEPVITSGVDPARPPGPAPASAPPGPLLFEAAWEVCNKVGGIYQVIRSKAPAMIERWGDRYCVIGPYNADAASLEFEPTRPEGVLGRAVNVLRDAGLFVHHGRWLISGRPRALLVEHDLAPHDLDALKHHMWRAHNISFMGCDGLTDGVLSFAEAVFRLLAAVCQHVAASAPQGDAGAGEAAAPTTLGPVVAHFHEWMGGLAIPMIRRARLPIATVFTTHATQLGRYLAMNNPDFYDKLPGLDPEAEAARYRVQTQHHIERACAHGSHVFTTVSSITGEECSRLLGRDPDVVLPNGLSLEHLSAPTEVQRLHQQYKERIDRFVTGHFFPSYSFDLNRTLYFFTSGRFEPTNKGFDLSLEAMARLNAELRAAALGVTVVFFIVTQRPVRSIIPEVLHRRGVLAELRDVCEHITEQVGERLFARAASGEAPSLDSLVDEYWTLRLRRTRHSFKSSGLPSVITHVLDDEQHDPVLNHIRSLWMFNRQDDPVKVIYHPQFISPDNPLWGIEYEHFVRGCHLGVFPSAYEPWGYTPLECAVAGVPSISSDLAGFGRYVQEHVMGHRELGLVVLPRRGRSFHEAAADLCRGLLDFCRLDRRERIALRNVTERTSGAFDWSRLVTHYDRAHLMAMERAGVPAAPSRPVGA